METRKAMPRRIRAGFFSRYCQGKGVDVGCGRQESPGGEDKVTLSARGWDKDDGDAHDLPGVADGSLDYVHASHCLEHLQRPEVALRKWFDVLKPGGFLSLLMPHRDLYEKKKRLPSVWNCDHKFFYLMEDDDPPDTLGMLALLRRSLPEGGWRLVSLHLGADGYWANGGDHPQGEYSFECVVRKI